MDLYLLYAVAFFLLAIISTILGFFEVVGLDMDIAKWFVLIFVVLAMVALVLPAPASQSETEGTSATIGDSPPGEVDRVVDQEAGVVCYTYDRANGGGIDCLVVNQTALAGGGR